jgi:hypothetical protein
MSRNNDNDNLDDIDSDRAGLISNSTTAAQSSIPEIPLCGFLTVQYYQPFFDVDTVDISNRILASTFFCRREQNFVTMVGDKPDAYGPIWIATTLVFLIAVASHLSAWLSSWIKGLQWAYDFQSVLTSGSVIFSYAFAAPAIVWFIFKQYEPKLRFVTVYCVYGYSLFLYIPAALLCMFPSWTICWLSLLTASGVSAMFLLRNLAPFIVQPSNKQVLVLLAIVGLAQIIFGIVLKLYFFYNI